MAGIQLSTPEQLNRVQELLRQEVVLPTVSPRNVALAAHHQASATFAYRNRLYDVPPVPYRAGIQLQELYVEVIRLADEPETTENLAQLTTACELAVALFPTVCRPRFWLRRVLWRWSDNPFTVASPIEVSQLLGFFYTCRMKSSVQITSDSTSRPAISLSTPRTN